MDDNYVIYLYDKISEVYSLLNDIMGYIYTGKLSYDGILGALDDLNKKILFIKKQIPNDGLRNKLSDNLEFLDSIAKSINEGELNSEELIPALGELAIKILHTQEYFTSVRDTKYQEHLLEKINCKRNDLVDVLEDTKSRAKN